MYAALITEFGKPLSIEKVPDPETPKDGIVIEVAAAGVCRSDWHAWTGHYPDIPLPHIPGHEMAGRVVSVGAEVGTRLKIGDRVTTPFINACGGCMHCQTGAHQVCSQATYPGFTAPGCFAQFAAIPKSDVNIVRLPDAMSFVDAASLGCRFISAYRAVAEQGRVSPGKWVAVHGCGGVGLSAIMIAAAMGALPIAIDISEETLAVARSFGAVASVTAATSADVVAEIHEITKGGAHVSLDALGSKVTCRNSVESLGVSGRHVQVGLMNGNDSETALPMATIIAKELEIVGTYGMSPVNYRHIFAMIEAGKLQPGQLVSERLTLQEGVEFLSRMNEFSGHGIRVIEDFRCA